MEITTRVKPIQFNDDHLSLLDQTSLPNQVSYIRCDTAEQVGDSIVKMHVRGAPAIGIAAAYGMALACVRAPDGLSGDELERYLVSSASMLEQTRPTAVNLSWALRRTLATARRILSEGGKNEALATALIHEAREIEEEDRRMCLQMALAGLELVPEMANVLTHCNAGALATGGIGTALGVVRAAHSAGRLRCLYANETRPFLQGARLTSWECLQDNIPVVLQADVAAASLLKNGSIHLVVVGADRIAANGDVANKVGTLGVAMAAHLCGVPFVVVAPGSTVDLNTASGDAIPIEERDAEEVLFCGHQRLAPQGVKVRNPSFDVTPAELITAIVTERGIVRPPYDRGLLEVMGD